MNLDQKVPSLSTLRSLIKGWNAEKIFSTVKIFYWVSTVCERYLRWEVWLRYLIRSCKVAIIHFLSTMWSAINGGAVQKCLMLHKSIHFLSTMISQMKGWDGKSLLSWIYWDVNMELKWVRNWCEYMELRYEWTWCEYGIEMWIWNLIPLSAAKTVLQPDGFSIHNLQ